MRKSDKPYRFRACKGRSISVEFRFMPGKRIATGCYDMPSAVLWAEEYLRDMGLGRTRKVPLFRDFAKDFFMRTDPDSFRVRERAFGRERGSKYYTQIQGRLDNHIMPYFGGILVNAITQQMIEQWMLSMKSSREGKESLSPNSRNKCLSALRFILDDVRRKGYRDDNPALSVRSMADRPVARGVIPPDVIRLIFPDDMERRIEVWGSLMWAVYFSIEYDTGMRPGEIAALRVCDVRHSPQGLSVATTRSVSKDEGRILERVKTTGKGYGNRGGLLYSDTSELLIRYVKEEGLKGEDLLFRAPDREDGLLMPETSNKHFKGVLKKLGVYEPGMVQYCLRHTYETARRGDLPDEALAVSMGHTRLRDDYDHQKEDDLIRRLEAVREDLFRNRGRLRIDSDIVPLEEFLGREG